jgi:hypothetical protein
MNLQVQERLPSPAEENNWTLQHCAQMVKLAASLYQATALWSAYQTSELSTLQMGVTLNW